MPEFIHLVVVGRDAGAKILAAAARGDARAAAIVDLIEQWAIRLPSLPNGAPCVGCDERFKSLYPPPAGFLIAAPVSDNSDQGFCAPICNSCLRRGDAELFAAVRNLLATRWQNLEPVPLASISFQEGTA